MVIAKDFKGNELEYGVIAKDYKGNEKFSRIHSIEQNNPSEQ